MIDMCNSSKSAIGNRINQLRERKGISQESLSKEMNLSREVICKWETGERDLKTEYTVKLADFFGVTCDFILRGIEAPNVEINKRLGLTDGTIATLERINGLKVNEGKENALIKTVNLLLQNEEYSHILSHICIYLTPETIDYKYPELAHFPTGVTLSALSEITQKCLFENAALERIKKDLESIKEKAQEQDWSLMTDLKWTAGSFSIDPIVEDINQEVIPSGKYKKGRKQKRD